MIAMNRTEFVRRLMKQLAFIVAVYVVFGALIGTGAVDNYLGGIIIEASIWVIIALGLNLVTGMTGQLVLGQAGFMSIGAYTAGVLLTTYHFPLLPSLLAGAVSAGIVGVLFGSVAMRLRGDYFAIVTLGFGEIIRAVMQNLDKITGGAAGLKNIPGLAPILDNTNITALIELLWVGFFMVLAILALVHLLTSSHGRAILSVREDEIAAEAMGINVYYTKVYAFGFSTILAGLAGGLFACHFGYLNPDSFNWLQSMNVMIIVVFGGLGSLTGTVAASFGLVLLQEEVLRNLPSIQLNPTTVLNLEDLRLVIYPLLLIVMMIFRPQGLLGTKELPLSGTLLSRKWWAGLGKRGVTYDS